MIRSKLRSREKCPIHGSYFCCGRELSPRTRSIRRSLSGKVKAKWIPVGRGVWRIPDANHPRGYREKRNAEAMHRLLIEKIVAQNGCCYLCGEKFKEFSEAIPEHIEPKGMGGARHDSHPDNIAAAHHWPCNFQKGSKRL